MGLQVLRASRKNEHGGKEGTRIATVSAVNYKCYVCRKRTTAGIVYIGRGRSSGASRLSMTRPSD